MASTVRASSPWLTNVPDSWSIRRVGIVGEVLVGRQRTPAHQDGDHVVAYLRVANVLDGYIDYSDVLSMNFEPREQQLFMLKPGDVLLNEGQSLELVGRSAIFGGPSSTYCFQNTLIRFRAREGLMPEFARYVFKAWLNAGVFQLFAKRATNIAHLGGERFASMPFPLPPLEMQRAIADFLNAETARIDALIAAKENLLAILAEKRRALVTQAVTRGLDQSVPMRDSGIPWLGEIPAHWDEVRLRFLFDRIEQGWSPQAESREPSEDEWGVLKLSAVSRGRFDESAAKALPPELEPRLDYEVKAGDFLLTRANTPSLVGDVCFVEATRPRLMLCDLIYRLALRPELVDGRYLAHFLGLPLGRTQIEADARGTSGSMVKISQEHIKSWLIPVPPLAEQLNIVEFIAEELSSIAKVESATRSTLELLRERREAVIAAAVTGRLDVEVA